MIIKITTLIVVVVIIIIIIIIIIIKIIIIIVIIIVVVEWNSFCKTDSVEVLSRILLNNYYFQ